MSFFHSDSHFTRHCLCSTPFLASLKLEYQLEKCDGSDSFSFVTASILIRLQWLRRFFIYSLLRFPVRSLCYSRTPTHAIEISRLANQHVVKSDEWKDTKPKLFDGFLSISNHNKWALEFFAHHDWIQPMNWQRNAFKWRFSLHLVSVWATLPFHHYLIFHLLFFQLYSVNLCNQNEKKGRKESAIATPLFHAHWINEFFNRRKFFNAK